MPEPITLTLNDLWQVIAAISGGIVTLSGADKLMMPTYRSLLSVF